MEPNRATRFLSIATTTVMLAAAAQLGYAVAPTTHAVWVYSVSGLPSPVTDAPTRAALFQNAAASNVNVLYVSVYNSTPDSQGRYLVSESSIAALISQAHSQGIQVYNAMADSDWPSKACAPSQTPYQRLADTAGYDAANPAAKFDGVMLDVEPGNSFGDFPSLLGLYQCFEQQASASGLSVGAAISAYWNATVSFNGATADVYQQIVNLKLSSVVVMGYLNSAGSLTSCSSAGGVICLDEKIVRFANSAGQAGSILVGLDTDRSAANIDTFYSLGQPAMDAAAQSIYSQFAAANLSFGGFAIHNYRDSYLSGTVPGWPASNPGLLGAIPQFTSASVVNSASQVGGSVAPGELVSIFGMNLGPGTPVGPQVIGESLSTNLGGVTVLFNGVPAPMVLAYSTQINCVAPFEIQGSSNVKVQVQYAGGTSAAASLPIASASPGIYTVDSTGQGQSAALNQDYTYNNSANPAAPGSVAILYLTGAGVTTPADVDGSVNVGGGALPQPSLPVAATIGGKPAMVAYAGDSDGIISGVIQLNLVVPAGLSAGQLPVNVQIGSHSSQPGVTIAVR